MKEQSTRSRPSRPCRRGLYLVGVFALAGACAMLAISRGRMNPFAPPAGFVEPAPMTFDGDSKNLRRTQVVPTLDTPVEKGKNVIWCASFEAAWKRAQDRIAGHPVQLAGAEVICERLNAAPDPSADLPSESVYAATGWAREGIVQAIQSTMKRRFQDVPVPTFPGLAVDGFVAYAYAQARVRFGLPYFGNDKPLAFTDSTGSQSALRSFGVREQDEYAYQKLREQIEVIYVAYGERGSLEPTAFAVDLCRTSRPNQLVFARVRPGETLAATVAAAEATPLEPGPTVCRGASFTPKDILLVPDIAFRLAHRFSELEDRPFANAELRGQRMDAAVQELEFRVDRSGAELRAEAKLYSKPMSTTYVADRPFLIYMKKRRAERPFFVMWVDNTELLRKWEE